MDIPVYHNFTLFRAWELAKVQLAADNTPKPNWLQKRSRCLKRMCKRFYVKNQDMLDEDDVKVTQKEPEDTVLVAPSSPASLLTPTASVTQVGLGKRSFSIRDIQDCYAQEHDMIHHVKPFKTLGALEENPATLWGILESELHPSSHGRQIQLAQSANKEIVRTNQMSTNVPSAEAHRRLNPKGVTEEPLDEATKEVCAALLHSSSNEIFESKHVSAYFSYYSPEDDGETHESTITISSPNSVSSDETLVHMNERSVSPQPLETNGSKLADDAQQEGDEQASDEESLEELHLPTTADEDAEPILPSCCNKVREEWENIVKIVEDRQKTEIANKEDDLQGEKDDLRKDHEAAIEEIRNVLGSKIAELEQSHQKASRDLREKGKQVREQKRDLKALSATLREKEETEKEHGTALHRLRNKVTELTSQRENVEDDHNKALQETQDKYNKEASELRSELQARTEALSESADLVEEWKETAGKLQAQHDSFCNGGPTCTQQTEYLKLYINEQDRAWRQDWNYMQCELQQATTKQAVLQQELEESQDKTEKAKLHISRHESKWQNAVEECKRAKELLNADDAKAASARLLQQSADDIASLVVKNRTKAGEIEQGYRIMEGFRASHDEQVKAGIMQLRRLGYENDLLRTVNTTLESDVRSLQGQQHGLEDDFNAFRIAHNNLSSSETALKGQNKGLKAENARLQWEKSNLQNEVNALNASKSELQRERKTLKWNTDAIQNQVSKLESETESLRAQVDEANRLNEEAFGTVGKERQYPRTTSTYTEHKTSASDETQTQAHSQDSDNAPHGREGTLFSAAMPLPPPISLKANTTPPQIVAVLAHAALQEQLATSEGDKVIPNLSACDAITDATLDLVNWANVGFFILLATWIIVGHDVLYKITLTAVY